MVRKLCLLSAIFSQLQIAGFTHDFPPDIDEIKQPTTKINFDDSIKYATNTGKKIKLEVFAILHSTLNRVQRHFKLNEFDKAIDDLTKVIELQPYNNNFYCMRARAKKDLGDFSGAIQDYTSAIEIKSDESRYYFRRAQLRSKLKDKSGAISDLTSAIKLEPGNGSYYMIRSLERFWLGDCSNANKDFQRAIQINTTKRDAYELVYSSKQQLNSLEDLYAGIDGI